MKKLWLCAMLLGFRTELGLTQSTQELINDGKNTENVTTQSMGYDRKSYSPLKQINKSNIKRLTPIWSTSLMNDQGELAAPTIYNGVMYTITPAGTIQAYQAGLSRLERLRVGRSCARFVPRIEPRGRENGTGPRRSPAT